MTRVLALYQNGQPALNLLRVFLISHLEKKLAIALKTLLVLEAIVMTAMVVKGTLIEEGTLQLLRTLITGIIIIICSCSRTPCRKLCIMRRCLHSVSFLLCRWLVPFLVTTLERWVPYLYTGLCHSHMILCYWFWLYSKPGSFGSSTGLAVPALSLSLSGIRYFTMLCES